MKLGVVLGGGGVRGTAHIGALRELTRLGIRPAGLAAIGSGGLIAALYACQCDWDEIEAVATSLMCQASGRSRWPLRPSTERLLNLVREHVRDRRLEELPIPLVLTAYNVSSGQSVSLREGPLFPALRVTTALPGFFSPALDASGNVLIGNVFRTLPRDALSGMDRIIAVDVRARRANHKHYRHFNRHSEGRVHSAFFSRITDMARADLVLRPKVNGVGILAFSHIRRCIDRNVSIVLGQFFYEFSVPNAESVPSVC